MSKVKRIGILLLTTLLMVGVSYAKETPIEISQQIGYDRWFNIIENLPQSKEYVEIEVEITFYTSLIEENTSWGGVDAEGNPLIWGTLAVPRSVALGTKFEIEGYEGTIFTARDRGGKNHIKIKENGTYRVDMFIPRNKNEDDNQYWKRVNDYGRITRTAKMYIEE